jgi:hypothetical protein
MDLKQHLLHRSYEAARYDTYPRHSQLQSALNGFFVGLQTLFGNAVFSLDRQLQKRGGVFTYAADPRCIFRISVLKLNTPVLLANGAELPAASEVIGLHLWNEQLPLFLEVAPMSWGLQMSRALSYSLSLLSAHLASEAAYDGLTAIQADVAFATKEETAQLLRICARYGFVPSRDASRGETRPLHRLGENILISMMVMARNMGALRVSSLRRSRVRVYLIRQELDQRFGEEKGRRPEPNRYGRRDPTRVRALLP